MARMQLALPLSPESDAGTVRDLTADVYALLEGRGVVTRDEIDLLFNPTAEEYELLRARLRSRGVRQRAGRSGGFVLGDAASDSSSSDTSDYAATLTDDERATVDRLVDLLRAPILAELVGDELRRTLRSVRRIQTGEDRPLRHRELAVALVIKHGTQLFADTKVREEVGKAFNRRRPRGTPKLEVPGRWHPGKQAAIAFVEAAGFPSSLAGIPSAERPADFEYLQGRSDLRPLQEFQLEVKRRILDVLTSGGRAIVTLPTGAGKTRTAVEALHEWLTTRHTDSRFAGCSSVLWLAHTEELCEQAFASFRQVWEANIHQCPLFLCRFWGNYTADLVRHRETLAEALRETAVFISTPHRIANLIKDDRDHAMEAVARLVDGVRAVVIDEAHRAAAPSYQHIVSLFEEVGGVAVIGLTATPFRGEYASDDPLAQTALLARLFESQIVEPSGTLGPDPRTRLQEMGVLAYPILETLETGVRLRLPGELPAGDITEDDIERIDKALRLSADVSAGRRLRITERIARICSESAEHRVLYFGPSVADAATVACLLRERGHQAAFISGATPDALRRRTIAAFHNGAIRVLCNCEVLTTGFDAPKVTHVVVGRPTVSQVLYEQMVGRGLRGPTFGGTRECVIVNCHDDYREQFPRLGWVGWREAWKPRERRMDPRSIWLTQANPRRVRERESPGGRAQA